VIRLAIVLGYVAVAAILVAGALAGGSDTAAGFAFLAFGLASLVFGYGYLRYPPGGARTVDDDWEDVRMPTERFVLEDHEVTVLNHVIYELTERDDFERLVPHPADRQALHNLQALLEREDNVVFSHDYDNDLERARERVLPEGD
jgi:hypothetical protein